MCRRELRIWSLLLSLNLLAACGTQPLPPPVTTPPEEMPPEETPPEPPSTVTFAPAELPAEVVALYGDAAAFAPVQPKAATGEVTLELAELLKDRTATTALVSSYDDDNFYAPVTAKIEGTQLRATLALDRAVVVVLDLGPIATNNYRLLNQLASFREPLGGAVTDKLCTQILCSNDVFKADQISQRVPELAASQTKLGLRFPPVDVGSIGTAGVCERCVERWPSVVPCLAGLCRDFPVRRKVRVRKNVYSLSTAELDSVRAGVAAMKARPETDPTSWLYQAKMHAVDSGSAAPLQDGCQHRQFFFFPWHRMYTYYFERILRKASGNTALTLPYWNYTDVPGQGAIPAAYRDPANSTNALYDATRSSVYNAGASLPAADVSYASAFAALNFTSAGPGVSFGGGTVASPQHFPSPGASGLLERSPHNNVHNDVSGDMATGESPRDPVFWLHHSNIDRLWNKWIEQGGGRTNPTSDSNWMNQTFTFFDEDGAQVSLTGAAILSTVNQLSYRYDDDPYVVAPYWPADAFVVSQAPAPGPSVPSRELTPMQRITNSEVLLEQKGEIKLTEKPRNVPIKLQQAPRKAMQQMIDTKPVNQKFILQLKGVRFDKPVGVTYLLFLNLPANARNPDHTHPNFVGTLGFFGHAHGSAEGGHHDPGEGTTESYDITELVKKLGRIADLKLTLVPSFPAAPADRKDLQQMVRSMRPAGEPRIAEISILRQTLE